MITAKAGEKWKIDLPQYDSNYKTTKKYVNILSRNEIKYIFNNLSTCLFNWNRYLIVNIYFSPSKLYGSSKAKFLAKNQLQSNEITKFCFSIRWQLVKKCQFWTFKVNFLCQKSSESFQKKDSMKNINLGAPFL